MNLNDNIKVKLTEAGTKVLYETPEFNTGIDSDGYYVFQLWMFMSIFGSHLYHGMTETFFENNEILVI